MSMLKVENLTFAYDGSFDNIFENVSFQIDTDWKLGFVGRNGRGKSTFLKLLLGEHEFSGSIITDAIFDYFPYSVGDKTRMTGDILLEVCPQAEEWELMRELGYLDVETDVLWRPFETLSNGEQTKALLSALFLNPGHFLLIDEPTNHLDMAGRQIVAQYLRRKKGFILVSHDRVFLDACVDHILSLNRADIQVQSGNFSSFMENFQRQQDFEQARNDKLKKDIKRLGQASQRTSNWSDRVEAGKYNTTNSGLAVDRGFVGHKAAKMMQRAKNLEQRQQKAMEEKSLLLQNQENVEDLKLFPQRYHAEMLIELRDACLYYDDRQIAGPITFTLRRGDRIALDGKNGSGKSSLLKLILGREIQSSGRVQVGSGLKISYVSQDTAYLHGSLGDYARENDIDESLFKAILRKMDFSREQFEKQLEDYSGGQKKKVLLARSLCERAHIYIWDEPLNFVDVYSRLQIESLILKFQPTMLFVEHDEAFRNQIATEVVSL